MSQLASRLIKQAEKSTTLDLGFTGLTKIPNEVFKLTQLKELRLSNRRRNKKNKKWINSDNANKGQRNNSISEIPPEIVKLKNLEILYIGGSTDLQKDTYNYDKWQISNISYIKELKKLSHLDLYDNDISDISIIGELPELEYINLGSNHISDITGLDKLQKLKDIDLSANHISDISPIGSLIELTRLILHTNNISDISALKNMKKLNALNLSYNKISDILILESLKDTLTFLSLTANSLLDISVLKKNHKLRALYLRDNEQIKDFSVLQSLKNLKKLFLRSNNISDIKFLERLYKLQELELGLNNISDISALKGLKKLAALDISSNNTISDISILEGLTKISTLNIGSNSQIKDFSVVKKLHNLTNLDISSNEISDISLVESLKNLQKVNISNNKIKDVAPLQELKSMTTLDISHNEIEDVSQLQKNSKLDFLDISFNKVRDISTFGNLNELKHINISHNEISDISPLRSLIRKSNIAITFGNGGIDIFGCPINTPPLEIIRRGREPILRYFDEIDKGIAYLNEAKLLIVGEGSVGKTSLCYKLRDEKADLPPEMEPTRGIDVIRLKIHGKNNKPFYINVWDFGGQDVYHFVHQFFLTQRSLYVLLTDTRRQDDNFHYWIPNIQLFGGDSPIVIVNNHKHGITRQVDISDFGKNNKFNIQGNVCEVNLKSGDGFTVLRDDIYHYIQQLPLVGGLIPESWVKVREELDLKKQKEAHISYETFKDVCNRNGIYDPSKIKDLCRYLHDLGILLWYDTIELKKSIILQPTWATDAVYLIIDDSIVQEKHGHFDYADIKRIWASQTYKNMHDELIALMKTFNLCYQKKYQEAYIIPSMLPLNTNIDWDESDNVRLYYEYEFMPKGIVSQLTTELHHLISDDRKVSRRSVVFKREGTLVRVEEIRKEKRLILHARGKNNILPGIALQVVAEQLESIHGGYSGIEVERSVPCPCEVCKDSKKPTFFEYEELISWVNRGKKTVYCNKGNDGKDGPKKIHIKKILGHIGLDSKGKRIEEDTEVTKRPLRVFISYSEEDENLRDKLVKSLAPLENSGNIEVWHDGLIPVGDDRNETIEAKLHITDIMLCLISSDFLANEYIMDDEVPLMLKREKKGKAKVIPVILRPCGWKSTKIAQFQALLGKDTPLILHEHEDVAFMEIYEGLEKVIKAA